MSNDPTNILLGYTHNSQNNTEGPDYIVHRVPDHNIKKMKIK